MNFNTNDSSIGKKFYSDKLQKWITIPSDQEFLERIVKLEEELGLRFEDQEESSNEGK